MKQQATELSRYMMAFDQLREAILIVALADASVVAWNQSACRQLLLREAGGKDINLFSLRGETFDPVAWQHQLDALEQQSELVFRHWHVRTNRQAFPVEEIVHRVTLDGSDYLISSARALTDRPPQPEGDSDRGPLLAFVLSESTDGMWDWNVATGNVFYSMPLKRMLGYGPYEIQHTLFTWQDSIHPDDKDRVEEKLGQYLKGSVDRYDLEYRLRTRHGGYLWIHDRGHVTDRGVNGEALRVIGMVQNINARKLMEEQLLRMATTDELTGLLNRRAGYVQFERLLAQALRNKDTLSVALLDLDHFKQLNDRFGHICGDKALGITAGVIASGVAADDVLMRWGGEEFLLVLPGVGYDEARLRVEDMRGQLENTALPLSGEQISLTLSGGVVSFPQHGNSIHTLVQKADTALYQAKKAGRNCVRGPE